MDYVVTREMIEELELEYYVQQGLLINEFKDWAAKAKDYKLVVEYVALKKLLETDEISATFLIDYAMDGLKIVKDEISKRFCLRSIANKA